MKRTIKKYFIPHSGNEYKPHFFRETSVVFLAVLILVTFVGALGEVFVVTHTDMLSSVLPNVLVELANKDRALNDIQELHTNKALEEAARMKANDMATKGYFAHYSPEGTSPWHWFYEAGYTFSRAGENLAAHFNDSTEVEKAWMNSPKHRENILNKGFTEIGIATARGKLNGVDTVFVVQMFGAPTRSRAQAPLVVRTGVTVQDTRVEGTYAEVSSEHVDNDGVLVATSDPSVPAPLLKLTDETKRLLTSPRRLLGIVYSALASIIGIALLLMVFIEIRKQHPRHIAYALGLLLLLGIALYIFDRIVGLNVLIT